jgi:hypothetical protein
MVQRSANKKERTRREESGWLSKVSVILPTRQEHPQGTIKLPHSRIKSREAVQAVHHQAQSQLQFLKFQRKIQRVDQIAC